LEGALAAARAGAAPSARAFFELEARLAAMAEEHAAAEARRRRHGGGGGGGEHAARAELAAARRAHAAQMAARDAVILGFRGQVEGLLAAARALQLQQQPPPLQLQHRLA
jgi:hypothetical protein